MRTAHGIFETMKVLVATRETQGHRATDFCCTEEGELVSFTLECAEEELDAACGCKRSLCGMKTGRATTTFRVEEREGLSVPELTRLVTALVTVTRHGVSRDEARAEAARVASGLAALASAFPAGTVLERRGGQFAARLRPGRPERAGPDERERSPGPG